MNFNEYPYPSRRSVAVARRGMVATSQPLAVQQGLDILKAGGSAVDAAIAAAAVLCVVEPQSTGLGGDAFALVWDGKGLHGLNGSGRAPANLTIERAQRAQVTQMPNTGWLATTVPGAPRAWHDLHQKFGRLPFDQLLAGAIEIAQRGFAVTPNVALEWQSASRRVMDAMHAPLEHFAETFCIQGRAPSAGQVFTNPHIARTLQRLAQHGPEDFYRGHIARQILDFSNETGGTFTADDLAIHTSTWVEPIHCSYRGYDVWEIPPNGHGLTALIALNILENFDLRSLGRESAEAYHLSVEAMKLAYADARRYIADPEHACVPIDGLLCKSYARERAGLITDEAGAPAYGQPPKSGTVYLCTADDAGMMVSFIQSVYHGFGSGVTIPGTGMSLQSRAANFSLHRDHPNCLAPGKRPYHTIIPGFLTREGKPIGPFGVMRGFMQPQGHVQVILNSVDWDLSPQQCLDAPRWQVSQGVKLAVESHSDAAIPEALRRRGHDLSVQPMSDAFGRGQIIFKTPYDTYAGASDGRSDGVALGY